MCISYVLLACYAVILTFTILNFVQFVCKSDQCCQVRHPLLTFYILIFCWICAEFFNNLFIATYTTPRASMTSLIFSHSFFKSMVGIEQIWLIVELSLRLTQMEGFERKQARGRFWVYAAHIFMLVAFIVVTCIMDVGVGTIDVMVGDDLDRFLTLHVGGRLRGGSEVPAIRHCRRDGEVAWGCSRRL